MCQIFTDPYRQLLYGFVLPAVSRFNHRNRTEAAAECEQAPDRQCPLILVLKIMCQLTLLVVQTVFLVGGFAASPWLYASLKRTLGDLGLNLCRPDSHTYASSRMPH